jgi:release factor glutamine methyltransferase
VRVRGSSNATGAQPPSPRPSPQRGEGECASLREAFIEAARRLRAAGIETPELDARLLLCHAAALSHEQLIANGGTALAHDAAARFKTHLARRLAHEPVSRILGFREFYGRSFRIDASTLDPRADSETLIDAALTELTRRGMRGDPLRILDLGTGSGILLLTLLAALPDAVGVGLDLSFPALRIAGENAERLGVGARASFLAGDWLEAIAGDFDLVVANPPYLAHADFAGLALEVSAHDPQLSLNGGKDGLDAYRRIASRAAAVLAPGGFILAEIGSTQASAVMGLFEEAGFASNSGDSGQPLWHDLAGRPRTILAEMAANWPEKPRADVAAGKRDLENGGDRARLIATN